MKEKRNVVKEIGEDEGQGFDIVRKMSNQRSRAKWGMNEMVKRMMHDKIWSVMHEWI